MNITVFALLHVLLLFHNRKLKLQICEAMWKIFLKKP